ncbi:sensor domain-containing diguanylate cyclase (plasmid) [Deinococcus taeanensis]|uniref:sensor domain-containing diguanylate cyclase n=1 Tax=Deinococcus taeanensis TaxID=2737050 RepID=UPI001CDB6D60|nr:sensor domain-containing diguanylate cyclase [Deinococcus taeanensis]UBV45018.1 sensor domain-containing diguanylate cyclase [Deinococcus taeanensis]
MTSAPLPEQEYARLLALARYDILDTASEETFDRLTRLTARTLRVPGVALNFVDQDRQWGKSCFGVCDTAAPREDSLCAWTILGDSVLSVPDARQDPRFRNSRMVLGDPQVRMYAGAPLITPGGHNIGTLCVFSSEPRTLDPEDEAALQDLAALAVDELELRLQVRTLEGHVSSQKHQLHDLQQVVAHAEVLEHINALLDASLTPQEVTLTVAGALGEAVYADWTGLIAFQNDQMTIQVAHHQPGTNPALLDFAERLPALAGGVTRSLRHVTKTTYLDDYATHPGALPDGVAAGLKAAAWVPLGQHGDTTYLLIAVRAERGSRDAWRASDRALLDAAGRSVRAALVRQTTLDASQQAARQDPLTGIPNRRAFDDELAARVQTGGSFTLALIDLDGFKQVNDVEGHGQGDRVLQVFAAALHHEIREHGRAYRYGGDEFALLLDSLSEDDTLEHVDIAVLAARQVTTVSLGASVGVTAVPAGPCPAGGVLGLLHQTDEAMYTEKRRRQAQRYHRQTAAHTS